MSAPSCGAVRVRRLDTGCGEEVSELNMESGDRHQSAAGHGSSDTAGNTGNYGHVTRHTGHVTMLGRVTLLVTQVVTLAAATTGMSLSRSAQSAHANVATREHSANCTGDILHTCLTHTCAL